MKTAMLIQNGLRTPDGTEIFSRSRHDYVTHRDENGCLYMVDGGLDYSRQSYNKDEFDLCQYYDDEEHAHNLKYAKWGTHGKDGSEDLHYIHVADMTTNHIKAVLLECDPYKAIRLIMTRELVERLDD